MKTKNMIPQAIITLENEIQYVVGDWTYRQEELTTSQGKPYFQHTYEYSSEELPALSLYFKEYKDFIAGYYEYELKTDPCRLNEGLTKTAGLQVVLDLPGTAQRMLATYQHYDWWTRPAFVTNAAEIPKRTATLLVERAKDYLYLLPMTGEFSKAELSGTPEGKVAVEVNTYITGSTVGKDLFFVLATGEDPYQLIASVFEQTAALHPNRPLLAREKRYPELFDYLGWCSWDAFYKTVNQKGLLEKKEEFLEKNLPVRWMMIDDGWHSMDDTEDGLTAFEEDPEKFPEGFHSMIAELKEDGPFRWVGVWHALGGYWGGVAPGSPLALELKDILYANYKGRLLPSPEQGKAFAFFSRWYEYLRAQGVDFVKVDGQSAIKNYYENQVAVGPAAYGLHRGLEGAVGAYFDGRIINCMGMSSENLWNRPITAVSRNSDDFVPDNLDGFNEHIYQNLYNAPYHNQLYYTDWDMFWTTHGDGEKHAAMRSVSGGPIYFSDKVGETNESIVRPLVYRDGRIIRCDRAGMPSLDCFLSDPKTTTGIAKITNTTRKTGVVAAFNMKDTETNGTVSPADVHDLENSAEYLIYAVHTGKVKKVTKAEKIKITLPGGDYGMYLIVPMGREDTFAPLGLTDKYVPAHAIVKHTVLNNRQMITLYDGGEFSFYSTKLPMKIMVNGLEEAVPVAKEDVYSLDIFRSQGETIVEIYFEEE